MIVSGAMKHLPTPSTQKTDPVPDQGGSVWHGRRQTKAKQVVSPESSKRAHVVYRCSNGIGNDIASMPLQRYHREGGRTTKVQPDPALRNMSYLVEVAPNRWMTPFVFKKTVVNWLLFWGNALVWCPPPPAPRELFILPASDTAPKLDNKANLWYEVRFPNGETRMIPGVEVLHVMINSTNGIWGKSVLEYAAETIGLREGQAETQSSYQADGLNMAAYIKVNANLDADGRRKYRDAYSEAVSGSDGAGRLAVFDNKVVEFEPITMKFTDAQFLESTEATDRQIANFFEYPEYKLNMGKQSYQSNEQNDIDYLKSCIDPKCVQWEQAARLRWISGAEQGTDYYKFNRDSILRTNAKTRAELHEIEIRSGMLNPNEAREHEDRDAYEGGDDFWMTANNAPVKDRGNQARTRVAIETK